MRVQSAPNYHPTTIRIAQQVDVDACIAEAIDALSTPSVRDGGRFTIRNADALSTIERSAQFWAAVEPTKRELKERTGAALAVDESTPETLLGFLDAYAEVRLLRQGQFVRLARSGGPTTTKDKTKALYAAYLSALDREMRLAQLLGLERKAPPVQSLADVLAAHEEQHGEA